MFRFRNLISLLACLAIFSVPLEAGICPPGPNLADTDGDGKFDYACVGDWNNNGTCEMQEDIQTAIYNLTDPGPKLVLLDECSFASPQVGYSSHGIIVLPSNTTLMGSGPGTLLNGFLATDLQSPQAVITNSDHLGGNSNIVISDLRIDGGWRGGDAGDFGHSRMGIRFTTCTDCRVERVEVSDTLHACLYTSNSSGVEFRDSTLKRCGNYTGLGAHFPCVYLYAFDGHETRDILVTGIDCEGSGASAFSTRRDNPESTLNNVTFQNNTGRDTAFYPNGAHRPCFMISGAGSAQYLNNSCTNTGGLVSLQTQSYYSEGLEVNASANITVDGLQLISSVVSPPIQIGGHAENFTLRNITVEGVAGGHCMGFETPLRNFSLDGAAFSNCGKLGIHQNNIEPSGTAEDEALTFRNVAISSVGTDTPSAGLHIRTPMSGLVLHNVSVAGSTSDGVRFDESVEDSSFSNLTISDVSGHGIYLGGDTRNVSLTQIDVNHAGADCIFLEGTRAPTVSHRQTSITESTLTDCAGRGIATAQGLSVRELEISDNYIDGVDGNGIAISLAGTQSENVELVQNVLRNFGRNADGDAYSGIKLTGALSGTMISRNTLHDENDQATFGIYHDVPGSQPSYLCTNPCIGTLQPTECLYETSDPAYQTDSDLDGTVDACEDDDADGVYDPDDNCQDQSNPLQTDSDLDGIGDVCDNCVFEPNPAQADFNSDSEGDLCDLDDGLIYVRFPDRESLNWQLEQEFSRWNIYRGDLTVLLTEGAYTQRPGSNPLAARNCRRIAPPLHDAHPPSPGQVAFYLIAGVQGLTESDLGHDSSGQLRPNAYPCLATTSRP